MKRKILVWLLQLVCHHKWILAHEVENYIDYSGYKVTVWRCYCSLCGKWKNKKFW